MRTGELARRAGVNLQTIRFYEREQLLRKPARSASGYRVYAEHDLYQLIFIKECQQLGFTLQEIRLLAELHQSMLHGKSAGKGDADLARIAELARERIRLIDAKICALSRMRERLMPLVDAGKCPAQKPDPAS